PDPCRGDDHRYYSCLEHLYALSRVSDLLLVPFEPVRPELLGDTIRNGEPWQPGAVVTEEERRGWWQALGMRPISEAQPFHSFYHEIVAVEQAEDPSEPISITTAIWSGFLLGQLLFARAGVAVRGGREHIVKEIAETSRLYWTYWRNNRHAVDDSHGWGSNSQWGTDFRRDYVTAEAYHYNVDGTIPLLDDQGQVDPTALTEELSARGALEIMTHRCLVSQHEGFWHVDLGEYTHREPRTPTPVAAHHNHG
ncbi:MAG TPA: hypothetical protein VFU72_01660, partial [Nitrolancea sp.]|nr:hypothetical protein [Nitrolancea sp.]